VEDFPLPPLLNTDSSVDATRPNVGTGDLIGEGNGEGLGDAKGEQIGEGEVEEEDVPPSSSLIIGMGSNSPIPSS
jgi:hypothetical protein